MLAAATRSPRHRPSPRPTRSLVWPIALLATLTLPSLPAAGGDTSEQAAVAQGVVEPGLRVYLDPLTGELIEQPTEPQERALEDQILADRRLAHPHLGDPSTRSDLGLLPFPLSDGGRGVFLDQRFSSSLWALPDAAGHYHLACGHDPALPAHPAGGGPGEEPVPASDGGITDNATHPQPALSPNGWPLR